MNKKITKYYLPILILILAGSISFVQFVNAESILAIVTGVTSPAISLISSNTSNALDKEILNSNVDNNINLTAGLFSFIGNIIAAIVEAVVAVVVAIVEVVVAVVQTVVNVFTPSSQPATNQSHQSSPPPGYSCVQIRCL
jgi:hypothetical protein